MAESRIQEALTLSDKVERNQAMAAVAEDVISRLIEDDEAYSDHDKSVKEILRTIEKRSMRRRILDQGERADGRGLDEVRSHHVGGRRATPDAWLVALYARPDPGVGGHDARDVSRRATD